MTSEESRARRARMRPEDVVAAKAVATAAPLPGPELLAKLIVLLDTISGRHLGEVRRRTTP